MWFKREISENLRSLAAQRPAVVLTGPRQTGKTSLLTQLFPQHHYVSLDLPFLAEQAEQAGEQFLAEHPPPLIIDEIQYAPSLLRYIKADIDAHRQDYGRYLLTGSQSFQLMRGVSESLAGRVAVLQLMSLSAREVDAHDGRLRDRAALLDYIFRGGYPELHAQELDPRRFYADYQVTYLERDLRTALQVRSLRDFDRFMRLAALRTGQLLSYNNLAGALGVTAATIKSWVSVLQAANIIYLLEPYYENLGKRIVKTPKIYFTDTGLCCSLAGLSSVQELLRSPLLGAMFETHLCGQLLRHFNNRAEALNLYFYRDHQGHEVDFVIPHGGRFDLIESKFSRSPSDKASGLRDFVKLVGTERIGQQCIVTPQRARSRTAGGLAIENSVSLDFMLV